MITLTQDGVEYIYKGIWYVKKGEHFINNNGKISKYEGNRDGITSTIVKPVPVEHTFSGIVFVEVDYRRVMTGEWYLHQYEGGDLRRSQCHTIQEYKVLKPVRLVEESKVTRVYCGENHGPNEKCCH